MKKYKVSGIRVQPFSGIIEAENQEEADFVLNDQRLLDHFILTGNLSIKGATVAKRKVLNIPDAEVINYY